MFISIIAGIAGLVVGAVCVHMAEAAMARRKLARPKCPYCTTTYYPIQWMAFIASITGQHKCRQCGKPYRFARLIGELYVGISWALLSYYFREYPRVWLSFLATLPLAMIVVTDLEAKLIPNLVILPSTAVMLVLGTIFGPALPSLGHWQWWHSLAGALIGFAALRILIWIGVAIFGEGALGEGDMTLATYVGAVIGYPIIFESLILTVALGGIGAVLILIAKRGNLKSAMPYGPYIALGATISMLWGATILQWYIS